MAAESCTRSRQGAIGRPPRGRVGRSRHVTQARHGAGVDDPAAKSARSLPCRDGLRLAEAPDMQLRSDEMVELLAREHRTLEGLLDDLGELAEVQFETELFGLLQGYSQMSKAALVEILRRA
jgi:hypothetical protein